MHGSDAIGRFMNTTDGQETCESYLEVSLPLKTKHRHFTLVSSIMTPAAAPAYANAATTVD